jgi:hypothetical protein
MTVDPLTGVINWPVPTTFETVPVTVQASNELGTSQYSFNLPVKDVTPPTVPTGIVQTAAGDGSVSLAWNPSTDNVGVAGYQIEWIYATGHSGRGGGITWHYVSLGTTPTNSVTLTGLKLNYSYSLYIRAFDAAGNYSAYSTVFNAVTAAAPDTVSVTSSASRTTYGDSVTLTGTVTPTVPGTVTPTGTLYFYSGTAYIGYGYLSNGSAQMTTTYLPGGTDNVTVSYTGDAKFTPGVSAPTVVTVSPVTATLTLSATPNPLQVDQEIAITGKFVAVAPNGGYAPGGAVAYWENGAPIGTYPVGASPALYLALGPVTITATYGGDGNYAATTATPIVVNVIPDITTTTLTVTPTTSTSGSPVTLSASVVGLYNNVPTGGSVTFFDGATALETASLAGGVATASVSTLPVGTDTLTAVFSGYGNDGSSTSAAVTATVNAANSSTILKIAPGATHYGQLATLTAQVLSGVAGGPTPTGSVTFLDGSTPIGTSGLVGGLAKLSIKTLGAGPHLITAAYSGNATYTTSVSAADSLTVDQDSTTTTLARSVSSTVAGQPVTFTATNKAVAPGAGVPTGTVTFSNGSTTLATATVVNGVAKLTISLLPVGSDSITATYSGDENFLASASASLSQTVSQDATTSVLVASVVAPVAGQSVTWTATVKAVAPGSGYPTGTVTLLDGATPLTTLTLVNGVARYTSKTLAAGPHALSVAYLGDTDFLASTSATLNQTVNQDATATTMTAAPSTALLGQAVVLRAVVRASAPGSGVPTGTVMFTDGSTTLGTATLVNGVATLSTTAIPFGSSAITASYGGDANYLGGSSAAVATTVQVTTTVALSTSSSTAALGAPVTFTAVVGTVPLGTDVPSGTVSFYDGTTLLGTVSLVNGSATLTTSTLTAGKHAIKAVYSGDPLNRTKTSGILTQTIA